MCGWLESAPISYKSKWMCNKTDIVDAFCLAILGGEGGEISSSPDVPVNQFLDHRIWSGEGQGKARGRPRKGQGPINRGQGSQGRIPPYTALPFYVCSLIDLVAPPVPNRPFCVFLPFLAMRVECVYTRCIVCGWRQDALNMSNVLAFREY